MDIREWFASLLCNLGLHRWITVVEFYRTGDCRLMRIWFLGVEFKLHHSRKNEYHIYTNTFCQHCGVSEKRGELCAS